MKACEVVAEHWQERHNCTHDVYSWMRGLEELALGLAIRRFGLFNTVASRADALALGEVNESKSRLIKILLPS